MMISPEAYIDELKNKTYKELIKEKNKLLEKNDKNFIKDILESNSIYFLTNMEEKKRLLDFISTS